jgi:hypothetical protein
LVNRLRYSDKEVEEMPYRVASLRLYQLNKMDKENEERLKKARENNKVPSSPRVRRSRI